AGIGGEWQKSQAVLSMAKPNYRRVIVKLSGEALSGPEKFGIHQPTIDRFAADLIAAHKLGIALGVVVGGGNVLRGARSGTSTTSASLSSPAAPAIRTSPPTQRRSCVPPRWVATPCLKPRMSTGSTAPIRRKTQAQPVLTGSVIRKRWKRT